ncbi:MAG: molybdopterin molybdotransferase MoeA [Deltaproteobacteria bacterium]|jgi:molybdenum cofactor synthesis domain-containing protein|nr:molybdopterin molybdotransferase MoeA [Deltaproteobacteria bacterium]MCL5880012.1 molybdopterin molybdotransferase MoeA [Deltaproteobacteria bacterium]MDA8304719.1 molybdopterin molybdotransferase MoeA [Deltaproteobacteria bacterium]
MQGKITQDLLKLAFENIKKIELSEELPVYDSLDRIISEDIVPANNVPPFVRSAVDGFALMYSDVSEKKLDRFTVKSQITAGYSNELTPLLSGEAAFVTTGAPIPPNADSVVLIEDVDEYSNGQMTYRKKIEKGSYISPVGDDIKAGELLFKKGHKIRICDIAALSGIGLAYVPVYKKPVVGILSGGNELVSPGENISGNKIYDINTTVLKSLIKDAGGIPEVIGVVEDKLDRLIDTLTQADKSKKYDLIISTGGTGASFLVLENKEITNFYDLVPAAIEKTGKLLFHGVRLVPGKPTSFGVLNHGTPIFALAGWPYSTIITFDLFVRPYIQKMMNSENIYKKYPSVFAKLKEDASSEEGVRKYFQVKLTKEEGVLLASVIPSPRPPSAARSLSPMIKAAGSFVMDENTTVIKAGSIVEVTLNDYDIIR